MSLNAGWNKSGRAESSVPSHPAMAIKPPQQTVDDLVSLLRQQGGLSVGEIDVTALQGLAFLVSEWERVSASSQEFQDKVERFRQECLETIKAAPASARQSEVSFFVATTVMATYEAFLLQKKSSSAEGEQALYDQWLQLVASQRASSEILHRHGLVCPWGGISHDFLPPWSHSRCELSDGT